jgi:hypothetical protein
MSPRQRLAVPASQGAAPVYVETGGLSVQGSLQQILQSVAVHWLEAGIEVNPELVRHPAILPVLASHKPPAGPRDTDRYRQRPRSGPCPESDIGNLIADETPILEIGHIHDLVPDGTGHEKRSCITSLEYALSGPITGIPNGPGLAR